MDLFAVDGAGLVIWGQATHAPVQAVADGVAVSVQDAGADGHILIVLHWEMRTFRDGSALFPAGTAGARGTCNGHVAGVGYTWDDDPARAHPDFYGYLDPTAFVERH